MSGRIRSIKPEVLDDEECAALSDTAWRLWVSMWCLADDYGNLRAGDRLLAAHVWQDSGRSPQVSATLRELQRANRTVLYRSDETRDRYVHIVHWEKHQRIDNAGKPRVPRPDDPGYTKFRILDDGTEETLGESPQVSATLRSRGDPRGVDHRSPIPISDPECESAPACPREVQQVQQESATTPEQEAAMASSVEPPPTESSYDLAKRVFLELWAKKYSRAYSLSPNLGPKSEHATLRWLGDLARERGGADAERWARHWVAAYLRDHGKQGALDDACHPLRWIESAVNSAGEPKRPQPRRTKPPEEIPPPFHVDPREAAKAFQEALLAGEVPGTFANSGGAK